MATALETPLMTALSAETWHLALSRTEGRDKLFRLAQYACKLARGLQSGTSPPLPGTPSARIAALEGALGASRQLWRLLKWVSVYAKPRANASRAIRCDVRELCGVISDTALFAYLLLDNVTFIHKARVVDGDIAAATRRAARFWLVAVLASAAAAAHSVVSALHARRVARRTKGNVGARTDANRRLMRAVAGVVKHGADAVVAGSLTRKEQLHPALVGSLGVISSAIGLWQVWPRVAPPQS